MGKKYQQVTPEVDSRWRLGTTATLATLVLFLAVYLPLAGQGFVRDDYAWILQSRVTSPDDLVRIAEPRHRFLQAHSGVDVRRG